MAARNRRGGRWLLVALLLLLLSAWLMRNGDPPSHAPAARAEIPRYVRPAERARFLKRRTLEVPPVVFDPSKEDQPAPRPRIRDPLLAAFPPVGSGGHAVVIEANALRNSPIGELLLGCLSASDRGELDRLKNSFGVDPLTDLDRVALVGKTLIVSGNFASLETRLDEMFPGSEVRSYGAKGKIVEEGDGKVSALWGGQLFIQGRTTEEVEAAIDRVEGKVDLGSPRPIGEDDTYGEIYGSLSPEELSAMLPEGGEGLAERLRRVAERVDLHVDASRDVGMSLWVKGNDAAALSELARSVGGALSAGRIKAGIDGEKDLAELLDFAKVTPGGEGFAIELGLPLKYLEAKLANCRKPDPAQP